jgi:hypothetical protein
MHFVVELMTRRRMGSATVSEGPNWVPKALALGIGSLTLAHLLRWRLTNAGVEKGAKLAKFGSLDAGKH